MQSWVLHPNTAMIDVILKYITVSIIYSDLYKQELVIIVQVYITYIYTTVMSTVSILLRYVYNLQRHKKYWPMAYLKLTACLKNSLCIKPHKQTSVTTVHFVFYYHFTLCTLTWQKQEALDKALK